VPIDGLLVATRFGLYADLAALAGLPLFWWSMRKGTGAGARGILAVLAFGGIAFSALWLLASAAAMAGTSLFASDWSVVDILLRETMIGPLLGVRAVALLLILVLLLVSRRADGPPVTIALLATVAAATLAWSGHAGATESVAGTVHRAADVLHILAASAWVGALLALLTRIFCSASDVQETEQTALMLHRFSLFGTLFVITLIVSGAINSVMIVGFANLPLLLHSLYGWLLLAKIALFGGMLILAAANRWRLTPALTRAANSGDLAPAQARLRMSLTFETIMALGILALVAALGTLDPLGG
jgi:copper resistance protein D